MLIFAFESFSTKEYNMYIESIGVRLLKIAEKYTHNIGDTVVYRKQGTYRVTDIKEQKIAGIKKEYYILTSVYDSNSSVYVPVDSQNLTSMMESVLTKEEIDAIIRNSENNRMTWIENTAERAEYLDEVIHSGDLSQVLSLLMMFILRKESSDKKPIRTFARDEKAFAAAQKAVLEAFAYPLGLKKDEVMPYIYETISKK